jgi:hypothetical protein
LFLLADFPAMQLLVATLASTVSDSRPSINPDLPRDSTVFIGQNDRTLRHFARY